MRNLSMAVVIRKGKVLVQQRFRQNIGMVFEFPGGSVNKGESAERAAERELWEETGLRHLMLLGKHTAQNDFGGDIDYVVFDASANHEPIVTNPVRQQTFYWLEPSEIPLNDFFSADVQFIKNGLKMYL